MNLLTGAEFLSFAIQPKKSLRFLLVEKNDSINLEESLTFIV
jgi:hypothetical protein